MKINLSPLIIFTLLGSLAISCDSPTQETTHEDKTEIPLESDKEVILEGTPSTWHTYQGTIPCADCAGIQMELRLENKADKDEREYELLETYLDTPDGNREFKSSGTYKVEYGIKGEPGALLIILFDSNNSATHAFIQESNADLTLLDQERNRIVSDLNYTLSKN